MKDIHSDKMMHWFHRRYFYIHALIAVGLLSFGGVEWLIAAYILPASLNMFVTLWALGILAHHWGYQNFEGRDHSTNSFLCNIITVGDGWHNNHHRYPGRWNTRIKWWEFDPTAWFIGLIRKRSATE
jgi:stearoyl-CoA desaturase (delta-9 desaturase)